MSTVTAALVIGIWVLVLAAFYGIALLCERFVDEDYWPTWP